MKLVDNFPGTVIYLNDAIQPPLTLGYERLNISEYKFLPLRCYNCQQYSHPPNVGKDMPTRKRLPVLTTLNVPSAARRTILATVLNGL